MLGLTPCEAAMALSVTRQYVADWLEGTLTAEENDIIEVGISLLEMRISMARIRRDEPTERMRRVA